MSAIDFEYSLVGNINGCQVEGRGSGLIDPNAGSLECEISFSKIPLHWDPAFNFLMTDTTKPYSARDNSGRSLRSIAKKGYSVNWRGAYIYDASNKVVGHIAASSVTRIIDGRVTMHSEIHDSWINTTLGERVIEIETPYKAMMMPMEHVNILTSAYCVKTDAGNMYWGWTTYPYITDDKSVIPDAQTITVEKAQFETAHGISDARIKYIRSSFIDKN